MPTVVFSTNRPKSLADARNLPSSASLIMTVGVLRFAKKLFTPVRIGCGTIFT